MKHLDFYAMVSFMNLKSLIKASMSLVFLTHVGYIGYELLYPEFPEIVNRKTSLKDLEFPIVFRVCATEANLTGANEKFHEVGYTDLWKFFHGESMYNDSFYGWAGHTENGSTIGSVEGGILNHTFESTSLMIITFRNSSTDFL